MAQIIRRPSRDLTTIGEEMNKLFSDFIGRAILPVSPERCWHPIIDIHRRDEEIVVRVELPEINSEDVDISIEGKILTIDGERKPPEAFKPEEHWYSERVYGNFHRIIELPDEVDADNTKAQYEKGLLIITMPKAERAKVKKVTIL